MRAQVPDVGSLGLDSGLPAQLERLIERQREQGLARGMQVYVAQHGVPVVDRAFGVRAQDDRPITVDTRFAIFSSSKPLTAAALHLLAEQGLVSYLDPVARFLPEFAQDGKDGITLRHLLLHQAGIADVAETVPVAAYLDFDDAIERICRLTPDHPPGASTAYHVLTGMAVVAAVVQRVSGEGFREFCDNHLFGPLGMECSTFGLPEALADDATDTIAMIDDRRTVCELWASATARAGLHPAIGGYSTARDLARFYQCWLDALSGGGLLLSGATARSATSIHAPVTSTFGFGYGFMVGADPALPLSRGALCSTATFGHPGMCSSQAYADPEAGLVVVLLANGDPGQSESDRRFGMLCETISRAVVG